MGNSAERLLNLSFDRDGTCSNPYCTVICYPDQPKPGMNPYPQCWVSPVIENSCSPVWNVSECFNFTWDTPEIENPTSSVSAPPPPPPNPSGTETLESKVDHMLAALQDLRSEVTQLNEQVRHVQNAEVPQGDGELSKPSTKETSHAENRRPHPSATIGLQQSLQSSTRIHEETHPPG